MWQNVMMVSVIFDTSTCMNNNVRKLFIWQFLLRFINMINLNVCNYIHMHVLSSWLMVDFCDWVSNYILGLSWKASSIKNQFYIVFHCRWCSILNHTCMCLQYKLITVIFDSSYIIYMFLSCLHQYAVDITQL